MSTSLWYQLAVSGAAYPEVTTFGDLPSPASAYTGQTYLVISPSGIWPFNYKAAGLYRSDGSAWQYLSVYPELLKDGNFGLQNTADTTKVARFSLANQATASTQYIRTAAEDTDLGNVGKNRTGWPVSGRPTLSFNDGTRTLTLTPTVGGQFSFKQNGLIYTKTTDSIQIPNTEALYYVYYNLGTLQYLSNATDSQIDSLIRNNPLVAQIYWKAGESTAYYVGYELHVEGDENDNILHSWAHFGLRMRWVSGIQPTDVIADGNGSLDAHAQFGHTAGAVADEDIFLPVNARTSTTGLPIFYLTGPEASPVLTRIINPGFPVATTGSGRLAYNLLTGGNWTLAELGTTNYCCYHVICNNNNDPDNRVFTVMGQVSYTTAANARAGAQKEIQRLRGGGIIPQEAKALQTFVYQTATGYTNAVKARIVSIDATDNWVDWTSAGVGGGGSNITSPIFSDSEFKLFDNGDVNKILQFELSGITTGNTRTLTVPNASGTIALTTGVPGGQTINGGTVTTEDLTIRSNPTGDGFVNISGKWANYVIGEALPYVYFNHTTGVRYIGDGTYDIAGSPLVLNDSILNLGCSKGAYGQVNIFNASSDGAASGDIVVTADNGTDTTHYINMGMNSSGWVGTGMGEGANKAYLYSPDDPIDIFTGDRVDITLGYDSLERIRIGQDPVRIHGPKEDTYDANGGANQTANMGLKVTSRTAGAASYGVAQFSYSDRSGVGFYRQNDSGNDIITADISMGTASNVSGFEDGYLMFKVMANGVGRTEAMRITAEKVVNPKNEVLIGSPTIGPITALNNRGLQIWKDGPAENLCFVHSATASPEAGQRFGSATGTISAPGATASGQGAFFGFIGHDGTNYVPGSKAAIFFNAAGNWTPTNQPANIEFYTTPALSTTRAKRMSILDSGRVAINRDAASAPLHVEATASGINEIIQRWTVSDDSGGYLEARNGLASTSANRFNPCLYGLSTNTGDPCLTLWGGLPGQTGSTPAVLIKADYNGAALTSRAVLAVRNHTTECLTVDYQGFLGVGTATPAGAINVVSDTNCFFDRSTNTTSNGPGFISRRSRGTAGAKTAVQDFDLLAIYGGRGYDGTDWAATTGYITFYANETFTATAKGTSCSIVGTAVGTTTLRSVFRAMGSGSTILGNEAALATNATDGFMYIPTCAGVPSGVPTAVTGKVAMVFDTTNNRIYIYDAGWIAIS